MLDILLPQTDAGVAVQAILAIVLLSAGFRFTRNRPDGRLFVIGLTVLAVAGFGLRAVH